MLIAKKKTYIYIISCNRLKENVANLSEQMGEAEKVIKKFQSKLAAEKLDREQRAANAQWEYAQKIKVF